MLKLTTKQLLLLGLLSSSAPQHASAELLLNFQPATTGQMRDWVTHGDSRITNQTPFLRKGGLELPEIVTDPETGLEYYHVIIGSQADGFIQETYIQRGFAYYQGGSGSAVGGAGNASGGNGRDPLSRDPGISTANALANPRRVLVRQIVSDGEINMEYLKDRYDRKARISQALSSTDINSDFAIDMRNSRYDDASTIGAISNTLDLSGVAQGAFDMASDTQLSNVTGGRYTYSDGSDYGGSAGSYDYIDGNYDHVDQNWGNYFDINQDNPWSYNINKPTE